MIAYRTYRAPAQDGEALIEPGLEFAAELVSRNIRNAAAWDVSFSGLSLGDLRLAARAELLRDAVRYSQAYRNITTPKSGDPIVMAGHQPSLFHPGVWFKNFALDRVTQSTRSIDGTTLQATAINLVVDNDVASSSAVRVPVIDSASGAVRQESVLFDSVAGGVPYEQNRIRDRAIFDSFDKRLHEAIRPIVAHPLIDRLWRHARTAAARCENVSCALAQGRHALEGELGLQTLEIPLSVICRTESFAAFTIAILGDLARFREVYNDSIGHYRLEHGIRSTAHPVPELGLQGEWIEAPFWIYGDDSPQRRAAWVRKSGSAFEISDLVNRSVRLTTPLGTVRAAEELASHAGSNWKLRPRALMTTMYARMILSDLFIHGIGGAKYDQLGDQIARRWFGITPSEMMVVSATVKLPDATRFSTGPTVDQLKQRIRSTRFSPELFANDANFVEPLLERKRRLLSEIPQRGSKKKWHLEVTRLNQILGSQLATVRAELESKLIDAKQASSSSSIFQSREYSFCLFNLENLHRVFGSMLLTSL